MTLPIYLLRIMAMRVLAALAVLIGILQIVDLLEVTPTILERNLGVGGVGYYALLRFPRLFEQAAPLSVLAGALFAFGKLAGDSAITALRSTGISTYRITLMAAPSIVVVALAQLMIVLVIAPQTDDRLGDWWQKTAPHDAARVVDPVTFRLQDEIVTATPRDPDGHSLEKVTIYRRDAAGRLTLRTDAPAAVYVGDHWRLLNPTFQTLGAAAILESGAQSQDWARDLHPADVRALAAGETVVTAQEASRALKGGLSVRPKTYYDTQVQRAWAAPLACLVMLLLAAPAAMANFRGGGATLIVECLAAGLLFIVFDGAFTALGESGAAPAVLAAWAAPAMFAALGAAMLVYMEG